ncbi:uncharacterized protein CBL_11101 [Carabus blaptoides fortunei]
MATLEDKILGEKLHNYCSSSEDEADSASEDESPKNAPSEPASLPEPNKWEGTATNTGPKGVLKDWQRFKQLESEKRADQEREKILLMKKLTLTCRTSLDDEREKAAENDPDLAELLDDDFLLEYQKQRMQEMLLINDHTRRFGTVFNLKSGQEFLDSIDKENQGVTIVVHIYEENLEACHVMQSCFEDLCVQYPSVKFCKIIGSRAGMSKHFKLSGVPALLVYKSGQLVGNFVRITDDLGNDFTAEDVQGFLIEHGMLLDKSCIPQIIKQSSVNNDSDSE